MKLSIIITSQNRPKELRRYFESINMQKDFTLQSLQVIFVDQGDNKKIFDLLSNDVDKQYIATSKCSLSKARNIALPYVANNYISFGDDDAWYDEDFFKQVFNIFCNKKIDGIGCCVKDEKNKLYSRYPTKIAKLTYENHLGISSVSMFLSFDPNILFDEDIGVGSKYNLLSGEETDYLWTYMERHPNFNIEFHPELTVRHPVHAKQNFNSHLNKSYHYARGYGYILKKHPLPLLFKAMQFIRPFIGMMIYIYIQNSEENILFIF